MKSEYGTKCVSITGKGNMHLFFLQIISIAYMPIYKYIYICCLGVSRVSTTFMDYIKN